MNIKYVNETHKTIINAILQSGLPFRKPIMLTANQFENEYTMSLGWTATNIKIPKDEIIDYEIKEITDDDFGGRIYLNKVWEAKL